VPTDYQAFDTTWGLNASGAQRGELLNKLARLMEEHQDELSAIEAVDNGKFLFLFFVSCFGICGRGGGGGEECFVVGA
jgi:hypothetical protein